MAAGYFVIAVASEESLASHYYLYATVAQVLASAFGFLAAFVLLRFQMLELDIREATSILEEMVTYGRAHPSTAAAWRTGDLLQMTHAIVEHERGVLPLSAIHRLRRSLHARRRILGMLLFTLFSTAFTIIACLMAIRRASHILPTGLYELDIDVIVAATICFISYGTLIFFVAANPREKERRRPRFQRWSRWIFVFDVRRLRSLEVFDRWFPGFRHRITGKHSVPSPSPESSPPKQ